MTSVRTVARVIRAHTQREGGGFVVTRPFPTRGLAHLDPFPLLDELGPVQYRPGEALGAPDHPHRGMETVTYILEGEGAHADSAGNAGSIGPADVQWMTAGAGVVHREMPSLEIQRNGGSNHGFQVWVNLPREHKMTPPRYQEISATAIPEVHSDDGLATGRIIAGSALGASAPIRTFVPLHYHHWTLKPGGAVQLPIPSDHNVALYVFEGQAEVHARRIARSELAVLEGGDSVGFASAGGAQLLLLAGRPLNEPIAWGGPFVMNTEAEIAQAWADFRAGKMGTIPPEIVRA